MTLDRLLEKVREMHGASISADVVVRFGEYEELQVLDACYEGGLVIIRTEELITEDNEGIKDDD